MADTKRERDSIWREHPFFFWGMLLLVVGLLVASAAVARRVPGYQRDVAILDQRMSAAERATRDRLLEAEAKQSELAIALLRREMRIKALPQKGVHLAISLEHSSLSLMHGEVPLRRTRVQVGPDSVICAPDGRTWRFVRPLGERRIAKKLYNSTDTVPEWVYLSRGEPVPAESERTIRGGLGTYIIQLDDGTEIYSTPRQGPLAPEADSLPAHPKPASFMAPAKDLGAIIDAIGKDAPVFIY